MNKTNLFRALLAGTVGTTVALIVWQVLVSQVVRVTMNPRFQSTEFLAVLSRLKAQPPNQLHLLQFFIVWIVVLGAAHGVIFSVLKSALPGAGIGKGLSFGILLWVLSYSFFEFLSPWGQFHEPVPLVALELLMWLVVALAEGVTIAIVSGI